MTRLCSEIEIKDIFKTTLLSVVADSSSGINYKIF